MTASKKLRLIKPRIDIFGPFRMEHSGFKLTDSSATAGNWTPFTFKSLDTGVCCVLTELF